MCVFLWVFFFFALKKTVVCFHFCLFVLFASSFFKEKERAFMELGKCGGGGGELGGAGGGEIMITRI